MANKAMEWHQRHGGFLDPENPGPHGLRMLREVIELLLELGCTKDQIVGAMCAELRRHQEHPGNLYKAAIGEEMADVGLLYDVIAGYLGIDTEAEKTKKLEILEQRDWAFDDDGVLWRPDRLPKGVRRERG